MALRFCDLNLVESGANGIQNINKWKLNVVEICSWFAKIAHIYVHCKAKTYSLAWIIGTALKSDISIENWDDKIQSNLSINMAINSRGE